MRKLILPALLGAAACAAWTPRPATAATDRLLRSTGPEIRFRCGSDLLRAKLRAGRLVVRTESGEKALLSPVVEPRAAPRSPAYGDGRLTLYKLKDAKTWALARTDRPGEPTHCIPQKRTP